MLGKVLLKYVYKNPKKNIPKLIKVAKTAVGKTFPTNWDAVEDVVTNENNTWHDFLFNALNYIDRDVATRMLLTFAIDSCGLTPDDIWFPSMSIRNTRKAVNYNNF